MVEVIPVRLKAPPAVTVVVPTRNEADNVRPLVEQLRDALGATPSEIVFVDDSDDHTPEIITALSASDPEGVRLLHRPRGERTGGLGGAVTAGLTAALAPWVVVMDGDLQHPPATVPELLAAGQIDQADAVVASRYRTRGRVTGLGGAFRRIVSRASGTLAKIFFPVRLRAVTDPMSGFFAVRRDALDTSSLRPNGYKILLELVVRGRMRQITEVPYTFRPRQAGESKASLREGLRYLRHLTLLRLAAARHPVSPLGRLAGFGLAGAIGTAVNSAALWALGEVAGLPYLLAALLAVQVAIVWNFAVIDNLVMPPGEHARRRRFGRFLLLNNTLTPVHLGLLYGLVQLAGLHYLEANVLAIVVVFVLRYAVTSNWVYGAPAGAGGLVVAVRRAVATRLLLAVALTAVAFPALAADVWDGLWSRGSGVPLLIPAAAAAALAASRIRPSSAEPDVHDRQVDGLLATVFLTAGVTLLLLMPADAWLVPAALSFLAGAAILLVGTRTVARLRWALLLPLLAIAGVAPAVGAPVDAGIRAVVTLLGRPAGPTSSGGGLVTEYHGQELLLPAQQLPGLALAGAVVCLLISAFVLSGATRQALTRGVVGSLTVTAVTVGAVLVVLLTGRLFGPAAFDVARLPVLTDAVLAITVAVVVTRWSPAPAPVTAVRQYLPRGRFALAALVAMAVILLESAR
ncbi:hypothetical protein Aph02nite_16240 [Actinoplanes philippinensis]|uniref:Glycosyltransferase involved in cell wall bisynthesis n=1 Tax=Actinoplanes philippinensis TaxID=35752 RepID=A0A1I2B461_9ACTN|nr:glycosyltransferase [Actinoplanes philippinensis]GIE75674.1 hypothetical protein Aph02nite_16240 [Actinoplanes philippinensis]SFE50678.1 Glycosyltransferase involved in cell wall bisynthesis [Actinoplanes philippinensis]